MGQQCENCRRDNVQWAQFCAHCGRPLSARETPAASPPPAALPASGDAISLPQSNASGRLMTLAIIVLIGFGWAWVMMPASRRQAIPLLPDAVENGVNHGSPDHHELNTPNVFDNAIGTNAVSTRTYQADDDLIDALYRLLSPQDVPIVVSRLDDDRMSARGTPDDLASLDAFVTQLNDRGSATRARQLTTYHLPPDQAKALADALGEARTRITVRRDGTALHVRASQSMHASIDNLLRHIQSRMQTMVDVSRRDY